MGRKKIEVVKGYKATNEDMTCRGFKYELGKEYKEDVASLCNSGFHFCENPLDVLNYYNLTECKIFEVEAKEVSPEKEDDSKRVSKRIKLKAEISLKDFIKASFEYIKEQATIKNDDDDSVISNDEKNSQVATSGYSSQVATSGYSSKVATSGDYSKVDLNGEYSVGMCAGYDGKIKGKKGNRITLAEWKYDDKLNKYIPVCVKSAQIDGKTLKEDTYYYLQDGEFKEW